ncbi:MAG: TIGR00703 family protein [Aquificae bacterium]|nr:TIGR00703 family protein [Aquificota bacterium]
MEDFRNLEFKLKHAERTLVFEKAGNPEKEREFGLRSLRDWGFDLLLVWHRGRLTYLLQEEGLREKGETFTHEEEEYTVEEVLEDLPRDTSVYAKVEERDGTAYILVEVRHVKKRWGEGTLILNVPAPELLIAFFRKKGLDRLYHYLESAGITSEFFHQRGQPAVPLPYSKLPAGARDFIRRTKEIFELVGFGRMSLAYYGKDKNKDSKYRVFLTLPTVDLFDLWIAEKLNNSFKVFK